LVFNKYFVRLFTDITFNSCAIPYNGTLSTAGLHKKNVELNMAK